MIYLVSIVPAWWLTYPSEKYESQLGWVFPIYGKIKAMFQTTNQFLLHVTILNPPATKKVNALKICMIFVVSGICGTILSREIIQCGQGLGWPETPWDLRSKREVTIPIIQTSTYHWRLAVVQSNETGKGREATEVEPSEAILKNHTGFVKIYDTWKAKNFAILIDSIVQPSCSTSNFVYSRPMSSW